MNGEWGTDAQGNLWTRVRELYPGQDLSQSIKLKQTCMRTLIDIVGKHIIAQNVLPYDEKLLETCLLLKPIALQEDWQKTIQELYMKENGIVPLISSPVVLEYDPRENFDVTYWHNSHCLTFSELTFISIERLVYLVAHELTHAADHTRYPQLRFAMLKQKKETPANQNDRYYCLLEGHAMLIADEVTGLNLSAKQGVWARQYGLYAAYVKRLGEKTYDCFEHPELLENFSGMRLMPWFHFKLIYSNILDFFESWKSRHKYREV